MRPGTPLPSLAILKDQARRLKNRLAAGGETIGHSRALELVAAQYGFRDWNTLHAAAGNRPEVGSLRPGTRVTGSYLGQSFSATLLGVEMQMHRPGHYRVTLDLDEAVDVVTFDSFSAFRKRIRGTITDSGTSPERTSNGRPHLELSW